MEHTVVWFELHVRDSRVARDFYSSVFGWDFSPMPDYNPDYWIIETASGDGVNGAIWGNQTTGPSNGATVVFVSVEDLEAAAQHVTAAGGSVLTATTAVSDGTFFRYVADPEGNRLGLWSPRSR